MAENAGSNERVGGQPFDVVTCPRCAYDLHGQYLARGEVETGACPECGLTFNWALIDRARRQLPGFVEHTEGRLATFVAVFRTWVWLVTPWKFWANVSLERPVRIRRAWLWLVVVLATPRALGLIYGAVYFIRWAQVARSQGFEGTFPYFMRMVFGGVVKSVRAGASAPQEFVFSLKQWSPSIGILAVASMAACVLLMAMPSTLGSFKVHRGHLVRACIYSWAWFLPVLVAHIVFLCGHAAVWGGGAGYLSNWIFLLGGWIARLDRGLWPAWGVIGAAWLVAYWWFALSRGWRIERPGRIFRILMLGAFLAAVSAFMIQDRAVQWLLMWFR